MMQWIRKIHKWASVIVGIQFLIWLSSGIFFNLMDHDKAAGHTYRAHHTDEFKVEPQRLMDPKQVLSKFPPSVELVPKTLLSQPYYLLVHQKGLYANFVNHYTLVHAYSGQEVVIDKTMANALAAQSYSGPGQIISSELITEKLDDFPKQYNPSWRVNFNDEIETSVYIEAGSGRVVGHSDEDKRFADFFFMLHFMDYGTEGSFNNVQIILFAFVSLWLSFTGIIWTVDLGFRGQYQLKWLAKKRKVKLFDKDRKSMGTVLFSTHHNLLDGLVEQNIVLPSTCGGGGTCGRCRIMINPAVNSTSADQVHFSEEELAQGYRLACQHFSNDIDQMTLMDVTNAQKHRLQLQQSSFISPFIKELRFKVLDAKPLSYKAGAFMRFFIPAGNTSSIPVAISDDHKLHWQHIPQVDFEHDACTRNYSCAQASTTSDELVFTIKMQTAKDENVPPGVASHYLCNIPIGSTLEALGPFEEFSAKQNSQKTMVLVGAGSGMAPLRAIIDEQLTANEQSQSDAKSREIHFFYGARNEIDLLYAEDFHQLAQRNAQFHYYPVLSQPNEKWLGASGYAQHILELNIDNIGDINNLEFYLCGPQGMMDEIIAFLKHKGVAEDDIRFDLFK